MQYNEPHQPSSAAAKAAAAAKALHRRAQRVQEGDGQLENRARKFCDPSKNHVFRRNYNAGISHRHSYKGVVMTERSSSGFQGPTTKPVGEVNDSNDAILSDTGGKDISFTPYLNHEAFTRKTYQYYPQGGPHPLGLSHNMAGNYNDTTHIKISKEELDKVKNVKSPHHPSLYPYDAQYYPHTNTRVTIGDTNVTRTQHHEPKSKHAETIMKIQSVHSVLDVSASQSPPKSTRRVIRSHIPLHIPRGAIYETGEPLPCQQLNRGKESSDPGSVFRSSDNSPMCSVLNDDRTLLCEEGSAHKILSLSKSFDCCDEVKRSFKEARDSLINVKEDAPSSPDEPPKINHWHKRSSSFEPSPLKSPPVNKAECINIDLTSSFNLFNESFDMNLEGILGPSASFGFGPMRSHSFGLGLGASSSIDYADNPCTKPSFKMTPDTITDARGFELLRDNMKSLKAEKTSGNLQVLTASPSSSFGYVVRDSFREGDDIHVGCDSVKNARRKGSTEVKNYINSSGLRESRAVSTFDMQLHSDSKDSKKRDEHHRIEPSLFGVIERHFAAFNLFSFLLPGAKVVLRKESPVGAVGTNPNIRWRTHLTKREKEVALRRINSALCAFGGMALSQSDVGPKKFCRMQVRKESFPERFYEYDNRLSWEIEEDSPIEGSNSDGDMSQCKRCGEPRTLYHHCPFKSSLRRNIGVMVYPAVNAFTATEPGVITASLSEVNYDSADRKTFNQKGTPTKTQDDLSSRSKLFPPLVSLDSIHKIAQNSSSSRTPQHYVNYASGAWNCTHQSPRNVLPRKKTGSHCADLLFVETQKLLPDQFRAVAQKKRKISRSQYQYPSLPLPYGQRKRISNAMFAMSKSIPGLTDECASVLGDARRKDSWDFAVAQLMTQVVVVTHCSVEDSELEGLSKYLLTLGIAC